MSKIKVHLAEEAGFCFGVKNAIALAEAEANKGEAVSTLGDLVHNQDVMNDLKAKKISSITLDDELSGTVLIRAHGVTSKVKEHVAKLAPKMVDATCPMVKAIKQQVDASFSDGALVLLFGHAKHPEAIGIKDGREHVVVISGVEEIAKQELVKKIKNAKSVSLFSQSTMFVEGFVELEKSLLKLRPDAHIRNTICAPTRKRQSCVIELAKKLPLIIVVGDPKSANTGHLLELASNYTKAERVLDAVELKAEWFDGIAEVGVTAGASTPDHAIRAVINAIEKF